MIQVRRSGATLGRTGPGNRRSGSPSATARARFKGNETIIVDHDNAGETRISDTLSGVETLAGWPSCDLLTNED